MDWVAVALSEDVPSGTVAPACIDGTDLAIWCSAAGRYHAWADRCPHRGMRLSHGFVRGETLACIYHGWQYGADAACRYIPAHPDLTPPKTICAQRFDCRSEGGAIWVALSEPQGTPPNLGGRTPVRSISVERSANFVADHLGGADSGIVFAGGALDLAIALQPRGPDNCLLHVFADATQDRTTISRHLEALRTELEDAT